MIQIAVCDDDTSELDETAAILTDYAAQRPELSLSLRRFQSPYDLLDCIQYQSGFDIYLLDIIMPFTDGIELGESIHKRSEDALIIYVTNSEDYAVKSYRVNAFDYLLKPLEKSQLFSCLDRAVSRIEKETFPSVPVKTQDGIYTVHMKNVMYVESYNRYYFYHLLDGSVVKSTMRRESFDHVLSAFLQNINFLKSSSTCIINMNFVNAITAKGFTMQDSKTAPVSRGSYRALKKQYLDYLLNKGRLQRPERGIL